MSPEIAWSPRSWVLRKPSTSERIISISEKCFEEVDGAFDLIHFDEFPGGMGLCNISGPQHDTGEAFLSEESGIGSEGGDGRLGSQARAFEGVLA